MSLSKHYILAICLALFWTTTSFAFGVSPAQHELKDLKEASLVERFLYISDYNKIINKLSIGVSGSGANAIQIPESVQLDFSEVKQIKIPFQIHASGFEPGEYEAIITLTAPLDINFAPTLESKVYFSVTDQDYRNYNIDHFEIPQFEQGDKFSFSFRDVNLGNLSDRTDEISLTLTYEDGEVQSWTSTDIESAAAFTENLWTLETDLTLHAGQHSVSVDFLNQAFQVKDRVFYVPPQEGLTGSFWLILMILLGSTPLALYFYKKST